VENFKLVFYTPIIRSYLRWITHYYLVISNFNEAMHIKRDYPIHIICSKCPPSAKTHAFRRLRKSQLIVVCGKQRLLIGRWWQVIPDLLLL